MRKVRHLLCLVRHLEEDLNCFCPASSIGVNFWFWAAKRLLKSSRLEGK